MLDLEANHLARAQAAAVAETEHHPHFDVSRIASSRLVSSGLMMSGNFCGSLR
jgi:hypothetical protein